MAINNLNRSTSTSLSLSLHSDSDLLNTSQNSNLWEVLRKTCEINREKVSFRLNESNEFMSTEFIKERLFEVTYFIDNKSESILKIANDESSDQSANLQTNEFLEQIIEQVEDLSWLMLRIPFDCGRHFWKLYKERFDQVLDIIEGLERIWWSIRRGFGGLPRKRDYNTECLFKTLPINPLKNVHEQWKTLVDQLKESWDQLKIILNSNRNVNVNGLIIGESNDFYFLKKCSPLVKITLTIFKKIRLQHINARAIQFLDNILDEAELIVSIIKEITTSLIVLPYNRPQICKYFVEEFNFHMNTLIGFIFENGTKSEWFEISIKQLNLVIDEIEEMNPDR